MLFFYTLKTFLCFNPLAGGEAVSVAIPSPKAQEFLAKLSRRLEADLSYWMDHARSTDQGRQHHYDENSPAGPRDLQPTIVCCLHKGPGSCQ
ncbi:augurin-A [Brachionichthys hirsutus]|uniref:augurin-A n=1 Tax=Brachionichthys hirsutus TaxID=412623 RepID=UPI003604A28C